MILSLSKISKSFDENIVLKDISFSLNSGDKLAIIGANGCGKSTLLKIINSEISYSGSVNLAKDSKVASLSQLDLIDTSISIEDFILEEFTNLIDMENDLRKLEENMQGFDSVSPEFKSLIEQYDRKTKEFDELGGYVYRSKVKGILLGLGFDEEDLNRSVSSFSGGELVRVKLARVLAFEPDILLLDEPTNHLDIKAVEWLESFLSKYKNTILLVSHDRYFIDKIANKALEIVDAGFELYNGNYTEFRKKSTEIKKAQIKAFEKQEKEIEKQKEIIRNLKKHGTEILAKRAKSREKLLDKKEIHKNPFTKERQIAISFEIEQNSGKETMKIKDLNFSYDDKEIFNNLSLDLYRNTKLGLIGRNGSGKSTLLKIIAEKIKLEEKDIVFAKGTDISYYEQNLQSLNDDNTLIEEIRNHSPNLDDTEIRTYLGRFLFFDDDVFAKISSLSGGMKSRLMLAKLTLEKSNFLLFDEPTNHLDIYTKEALENALIDFKGSVIVVSHDRYFLEKTCTKIAELKDGKLKLYDGSYSYYEFKRQESDMPDLRDEKISKTERKKINQAIRKNKNDRKKLEEKIAELEKDLAILNEELFDEKIYLDSIKYNEKEDLIKEKNKSLDLLISELIELMD